jgi:hypothetical protein
MYVWDELEAWTQDRGVILVDIIRLGGAGKIAKGSRNYWKRISRLLEKKAQIVGKESYRGSNSPLLIP